MTRGKFNTTCDVFKGPGSGSPGFHVGTFPCKLVREDAITTVGAGAPLIPFYLTIDAHTPTGSWTVGTFGLDPSLADQIAIPAGSSVRFWVLYTDLIAWHSPSYFRAYLVELPIPPPIGKGGVILGGAAEYNIVINVPSAGGLIANASGHRIVAKKYTGKGGTTLNARGQVRFLDKIVGSGGVIVNSGAVWNHVFKLSGKGGVITDSGGIWVAKHVFEGFGGVMADSGATAAFVPGSGGAALPMSCSINGYGNDGIDAYVSLVPPHVGLAAGDKVSVVGTGVPFLEGLWIVYNVTALQCFLQSSGVPPPPGGGSCGGTLTKSL